MDINRINSKLNLYEVAKKEKEVLKNNTDKTKESASKTEKSDKITVSSEARSLNILDFAKSKIKSEMNRDLSDMNLERINALKEQIKNGTYRINSKDIAAAVISGGDV